MEIIYGNTLADRIKADMKQKIDDIRAEGVRLPLLSVVLVGNDPASMSYVRGKEKACSSIGMLQRTIRLDENVSQKELNDVIMSLNLDSEVDGILVQMPLPSHLDETAALELIDPQKDVDGLHPMNAGCLLTNRPGFIPCTPQGVMAMLDSIGCKDLSGKRAVVCLLRLSPNYQYHSRPTLAVTAFKCSRLSWLDGRCVQGPGTYSPRHG